MKTCWVPFSHIFKGIVQIFRDFVKGFRDFAHISMDFTRILRDFARIFTKSKLLGVHLHPLHPASYASACA